MDEWGTTTVVATGALGLVVLLGVLVALLLAANRRTRAELAATREAQADLVARIEALARPQAGAHPDVEVAEYVITDVGSPSAESGPEAPGRIEGRLFVDIVARETLVKAASWSYGLARSLTPENRNRLRFEMRRETRRAARRRRADVKEALRQYYARLEGDVA